MIAVDCGGPELLLGRTLPDDSLNDAVDAGALKLRARSLQLTKVLSCDGVVDYVACNDVSDAVAAAADT
jgi:hypothetical protein